MKPTCAALVLCAITTTCVAEKNAALKPALVTPGETALKDNFDGKSLGKTWSVNKGTFTVADGIVTGSEKPADKHAAVLTCKIPNRNSVIRFSFRLGEARAFHLSFNKKRGHLFRVIVTRNGTVLRTDKPSKRSMIRPAVLAKSGNKIAPDKWYTMLVEVSGNTVAVQVDNGSTLKGSHSSLDVDKPSYRFIVRGKGFQLDDLMIQKARQ